MATVRAEFYIDGNLAYTDVGPGHYHFNGGHSAWNTKLLTDGPHVLRMKVVDGPALEAKPYRADKPFRFADGSYPKMLEYKDFVELGKVKDEDGKGLKDGQTIESAEQALRGVQPQIREATMPANAGAEARARHFATPFGVQSAAGGTSAGVPG